MWQQKKVSRFLFATILLRKFEHLSSFADVTDGNNHTECRISPTSFVFHTFNSVFSQNTFSPAKRVENNFLLPLLFFIPFSSLSSSQMPPKTKNSRNGFFSYPSNGPVFHARISHTKKKVFQLIYRVVKGRKDEKIRNNFLFRISSSWAIATSATFYTKPFSLMCRRVTFA